MVDRMLRSLAAAPPSLAGAARELEELSMHGLEHHPRVKQVLSYLREGSR